MPVAEGSAFSPFDLSLGKLAEGFQQAEPQGIARFLRLQERAFQQVRQTCKRLRLRAHGPGGVRRPAAAEDRQASEEALHVGVEHLITGGQDGIEAVLARPGRLPPVRQQSRIVAQPGHHLGRGQHRVPGRHQLQGQGDTVERAAKGHDCPDVVAVQAKPRAYAGRLRQEELRRLGPQRLAHRGPGFRYGERGYRPGNLLPKTQWLAAGGEEAEAGAGAQQKAGQVGTGREQRLAIVQHQQGASGRRGSGPGSRQAGAPAPRER